MESPDGARALTLRTTLPLAKVRACTDDLLQGVKAAAILQAHAGAERAAILVLLSGLDRAQGGQYKHEAHVVTLDCADGSLLVAFPPRVAANMPPVDPARYHAKMRTLCSAATSSRVSPRQQSNGDLLEEACTLLGLPDGSAVVSESHATSRRRLRTAGATSVPSSESLVSEETKQQDVHEAATIPSPSAVGTARMMVSPLRASTAMEKAARTPTTTHVPAARKTRSPIHPGSVSTGERTSTPKRARMSAAKRLLDTEHGLQ